MSEKKKLKLGSELRNDQLFDRGLQLTDEIKKLEEQSIKIHEELEYANRKIKEYQDQAAEQVAKATDEETGKKKYTNETTRIAARRALLRDLLEYNQVIDNISSMKKSMKLNDIEIKYRIYRLRLINSYIQQTLE